MHSTFYSSSPNENTGSMLYFGNCFFRFYKHLLHKRLKAHFESVSTLDQSGISRTVRLCLRHSDDIIIVHHCLHTCFGASIWLLGKNIKTCARTSSYRSWIWGFEHPFLKIPVSLGFTTPQRMSRLVSYGSHTLNLFWFSWEPCRKNQRQTTILNHGSSLRIMSKSDVSSFVYIGVRSETSIIMITQTLSSSSNSGGWYHFRL